MPLKAAIQRGRSVSRWSLASQKHRGALSVNMISLPLGDFRHLSHIGSTSHRDNFGDLSFLQRGHSLLLHTSRSEQNLLLACAPPPKPPRLNIDILETREQHNWDTRCHHSSQQRKKCSSLPLLDSLEGQEPVIEEEMEESIGQGSLNSRGDVNLLQTNTKEAPSGMDDSGFSLDLDLGPSILDDVLQVMDRFHQ